LKKGTLYLIPVPLSENSERQSVPAFHSELINTVRTYIAENAKTARHWLKRLQLQTPQNELTIHVYGKREERAALSAYFHELETGEDVALMSEAGCPAIADPGSMIVAEAHRRGIRVCPLVGPSSIVLALMASGFNGQQFAFNGYLPIEKEERAKRIKELESLAWRHRQTQLFIETPFRNNQMLDELLRSCKPDTFLCVAVDLTAPAEQIITATIASWRKKKVDLHKRPAIFLIGK
jgi:16S rRNA (cytidine1402-2'-O)-methyltransferase